jgi:hypothetical protein
MKLTPNMRGKGKSGLHEKVVGRETCTKERERLGISDTRDLLTSHFLSQKNSSFTGRRKENREIRAARTGHP